MTDNPSSYAETSPLAGAALAFGDLVEDTDARRAAIQVRYFETTQAAREAADRDEIADGDVIVVEAEKVVGFLVVAHPVALTDERGTFPHLSKPGRDYADGDYIDSVVVAEGEARARGFLLRDEDAQDRLRSMRRLSLEAAERVCAGFDPWSEEWKTALGRLTVAMTYLNEHDPVAARATAAKIRRIHKDLEQIDAMPSATHTRD